MPTILSHAAVPLALGLGLGQNLIPRRLLLAGIAACMLPDADVVGFRLGIAYGHALGHRGASHSLVFAAAIALLAWLVAPALKSRRGTAFCFILACVASHPLLDMLTNGGMGVALWWPWSDHREFFAHAQVVEVAPISLKRILGPRGLTVITSELHWVWGPCALLGTALALARWAHRLRRPAMASNG